MKLIKIIIFILSFSSVLNNCTLSTISKTMYTEGKFTFRQSNSEVNTGYYVTDGILFTDLDGNFSVSLTVNGFEYGETGNYYIIASDDKNGQFIAAFNSLISVERVDYTNYYFMYFIFADFGKICLVR